jgi:hypothetical protein
MPLSLGEITRAASPTCSGPASLLPLKSSTMSLYTRNGYGQVSYGGPRKPMDTIKHLHHLHLSTTSIPIYSDVTMHLALRNLPSTLDLLFRSFPRFSEIVAQCLEVHIRRVSSVHFSTVSIECRVIFDEVLRISSHIIGCSHVMHLALSSPP